MSLGAIMPDGPRLALLNPWQHGFPLVREPFGAVAAATGLTLPEVLDGYAALLREGALSRIGAVFSAEAGGAALLSALRVPPDRLDAVAAVVSAQPGVNHNYAREHAYNLWFVVTGADARAVEQALVAIETSSGLAALRLPMRRAYRIDLGFDLLDPVAWRAGSTALLRPPPVTAEDSPLAALAEAGLPLLPRPFDAWADALGWSPATVLARLRQWLADGTLRRFGTVVRHHEFGFVANAMTVFDVSDDEVDVLGAALARVPGLNLVYRRERAPGWPYNLYCMVHGRNRASAMALVDKATFDAGLQGLPRAVLFSTRRYKQTGARRFRASPAAVEVPDAVA